MLPADDQLLKIKQEPTDNATESTTLIKEETLPLPPKQPKWADDFLDDVIICTGDSPSMPPDLIAQAEIGRYQTAVVTPDKTILIWWKENDFFPPNISQLAKKYLAIPASSISSERVFSLAGALVNKKRSRLNGDNIDMIITLNKNMDYYWS